MRVVGADGEFVRREPLIDDELWFKVQDVLAANSRPKSGIRNYASEKFPDGKEYRYYYCQYRRNELRGVPRKCDKLGSVPQGALDEAVSAKLLEVVGQYELTEKRVIEGEDHSATLKKLGMQIADLTVVAEVADKWVVNIGLGTLREQLQHVKAI